MRNKILSKYKKVVIVIHTCENCPEIQDQVNNCLEAYGYENILRHPEDEEEIMYEICSCCSCNKLDTGKIWYVNSDGCEYYPEIQKRKKSYYSKKKRRSKRERDSKYKKHLKFLAENITSYPPAVCPMDEKRECTFDHIFFPFEKASPVYYKRFYKGKKKSNRYKYYKKYANRKVRRYNGVIQNGSAYKKVFDYWWAVD